jgi:hypothetical protein
MERRGEGVGASVIRERKMECSTVLKNKVEAETCEIATAFGFAMVYDAGYLMLVDLQEGGVCYGPEN